MAENKEELKESLDEMEGESEKVGLKLNIQKTKIMAISHFYGPTLTSINDYWKNHSFDYTDLCWQSDNSAF